MKFIKYTYNVNFLRIFLEFQMRLYIENDPKMLPGGSGHMVPVRSMIIKTS